ncbi:hypothetical protein CULC0102_2282 [Corynebacterium ulcerans 0102]|nr:hypothetical protein AFK72_10900 [Corynebacterium ulcerans]OIS06153.1 hypothetical protein BHG00_05085 [Corynebacterium ulcerans]BAM28480.1 hypothetical protein CULC0102_2282 [Corynebacterium ulcerans 0102]
MKSLLIGVLGLHDSHSAAVRKPMKKPTKKIDFRFDRWCRDSRAQIDDSAIAVGSKTRMKVDHRN